MKYIIILSAFLLFFSCNSDKVDQSQKKTPFPLEEMSIVGLQKKYDNKELSITEVVQMYIDRIELIDKNGPTLNSIIIVNPDALEIAKQLDEELLNGNKRGPMHGIPVILKDNIDTHDKMPTTAGSRALANSFPDQDSYVAKKLREAGAVILGKANLSEWANFRGELSTSGWSGVGGQTKNPYDISRNPCGSSSGSAVAVSANLTMVAIGTETNGSIVCPSHANGIVGIKPTVGLVSRSGIIPISFTQDIAGPMARTVTDAAICLGALTGVDPNDSKTQQSEAKFYEDYTQFLLPDGIQGKRIGIYTAPMEMNYKVDTLFKKAIQFFKENGAEMVEIEQIGAPGVGGNSFQVMLYEYKDGLNKYFKSLCEDAPIKSVEELIAFNKIDSVELKYFNQKYLEMANEMGDIDSKEYLEVLKALKEGAQKNGMDKIMKEHNLDAVIAPTGSPAWLTDWTNGDSYQLGSSSPAAQAGYPNITVPMGFIDGLPVGISIFGRAWSEPVLIEIAYAFEQGTKHRKAPKLYDGVLREEF